MIYTITTEDGSKIQGDYRKVTNWLTTKEYRLDAPDFDDMLNRKFGNTKN